MLSLTAGQLEGLRRRAREAAPDEVCGFLLGARDQVAELIEAPNTHPEPSRGYRIHPRDCLAALRKARKENLQVLGVFHSHPEGPANLSTVDRREAHPGWHYLVLGRDRESIWEA